MSSINQFRVGEWVHSRFGVTVLMNIRERVARVLEEAVELAQSEGLTESEANKIVASVFAKPSGFPPQEAAGVAVTLLAWAECQMQNLDDLVEKEIDRIESLPINHFRKRQQAKADAGTAMAPV